MKVYEITLKAVEAYEDITIWIATDHIISIVPNSDLYPTIKEIDVSQDAPGVDLVIL